jgi:hypothetical protein
VTLVSVDDTDYAIADHPVKQVTEVWINGERIENWRRPDAIVNGVPVVYNFRSPEMDTPGYMETQTRAYLAALRNGDGKNIH